MSTREFSIEMASINDVLKSPKWPAKWPFYPSDFKRQDESDDSGFYAEPRLVYHIDDAAVGALTAYYSKAFAPNDDVLDICSSWVSHFPNDVKLGRRVGIGMVVLDFIVIPFTAHLHSLQDLCSFRAKKN